MAGGESGEESSEESDGMERSESGSESDMSMDQPDSPCMRFLTAIEADELEAAGDAAFDL